MGRFAWRRQFPQTWSKTPFRRTTFVASVALLILILLYLSRGIGSNLYRPAIASYRSWKDPLLKTVANETLGFQKIFCLGLPSRADHRDAIELSAAATNLTVNWIDGVTDVENKSLPVGIGATLGKQGIGSWRAHMNALQIVVKDGVSSGLILEDDADWDIRIKQQMQDFALSTRALTQPLAYEYTSDDGPDTTSTALAFGEWPLTKLPRETPFGDDWDVLWLGHCGVQRPGTGNKDTVDATSETLPRTYVVQPDDQTVPEPHYLRDSRGRHGAFYTAGTDFQNHTRIVHHPQGGFCSVAYAVSQRGARKMLWYMSVRAFDGWFDTMLPNFCDGKDAGELERPTCVTVQPQFFDQHVPRGELWKESDIFPVGVGGSREKAETPNIRWSTRINLPKLLSGETNYTDQWPDTG